MNFDLLKPFDKIINEYYQQFINKINIINTSINIRNCSPLIKSYILKQYNFKKHFINLEITGSKKIKSIELVFYGVDNVLYFNLTKYQEILYEVLVFIKKYLKSTNIFGEYKKVYIELPKDFNNEKLNNFLKTTSFHQIILFSDKHFDSFIPFLNCPQISFEKKEKIFESFFQRKFNDYERIYFNIYSNIPENLFLYINLLIKYPNYKLNDILIDIVKDILNADINDFFNHKIRNKIESLFIYNVSMSFIFKITKALLNDKYNINLLQDEINIINNFKQNKRGIFYLEHYFLKIKTIET